MALGEDKEVIVVGDVNINRLHWGSTNQKECDLTQELHSRILPLGVSQVLTGASRIGTNVWGVQEESGLDHLYTNRPDKLASVEAKYNGISDHKYAKAVRNTKCQAKGPKETRKRRYKKFKNDEFIKRVREFTGLRLKNVKMWTRQWRS